MRCITAILCLFMLLRETSGETVFGTPEQVSQTIKVKILSKSSIVIQWDDADTNGKIFTPYKYVEISYQDAKDESAKMVTKPHVPRRDYGTILTGLNQMKIYLFFITYVDPRRVRSLPLIVTTLPEQGRPFGIYDLILKATPTSMWKHKVGYGWHSLEHGHPILSGQNTGFDNKNYVSPFAFRKGYTTYMVGMRPMKSGSTIRWHQFSESGKSLQTMVARTYFWESNTINEFMKLFGNEIPSYGLYPQKKIGFKLDWITFGVWFRNNFLQSDYFFGIGLDRPPYVGYLQDVPHEHVEYYGYILGKHISNFIVSTAKTCRVPVCGTGTLVYTHVCKVTHPKWKDLFCSPKANETCIEKECPFGIPENLRITQFCDNNITVQWDAYNLTTLHAATSFKYMLRIFDANNKQIESVTLNRSYTQYVFQDLRSFASYSIIISGYSTMGAVAGTFSEPVLGRTRQGVPDGKPTFTSAVAINSSCVLLKWQNIPKLKIKGYLRSYELKYHRTNDSADISTVETGLVAEYLLCGLLPFRDYIFELRARNDDHIANKFSTIQNKTGETNAAISPPNITILSTKRDNFTFTWEKPDTKQIFGIIRGYTLGLQAIYTKADVTIDINSKRKKRTTSLLCSAPDEMCTNLPISTEYIIVPGADNLSYSFHRLRGNTVYNISVAVNTKFTGVFSPPVQIITPEGTPTMSAVNFTCRGRSSSSLMLKWTHLPPAYLEGVRTQYMAYYQLEDRIMNESYVPSTRKTELYFLKANTEYVVWLTAFTKVGEGASTPKLRCLTFETTPEDKPLNIKASSFHHPYASFIQWNHIPENKWHGTKLGYTLFYEKLSTGDVKVQGEIKSKLIEVKLVKSYFLTGLEVYSVYRLRIAARTNKGVGVISESVVFETCRVPQAHLILNYVVYPPYIDEPNDKTFRPKGILMDLAEQMLLKCAHICASFNESIHITYNRVKVPSFSNITNLTFNGSQLQVPRMVTGKFSADYSLIVTATSPGFILLEVPDNAAEAGAKSEERLLAGIFATIPICAFYFILNWLFGAVFWFCEPTKVSHKGHGMSIAGIFEGFYLTIMTSTTVGYGDKIPTTGRGRIYIMLWTLLGLILTGIVTGSLSSALSAASINSMREKLPDDVVIALYGSSEYKYGEKKIKKFEKNGTTTLVTTNTICVCVLADITYLDYESVLEQLKNKTVKYALIDRYVAAILKTSISEHGLKVKNVFDVSTGYGVAAFGEMKKLEKCGTKYALKNADVTSKAISKFTKELKEKRLNGKEKSKTTDKEESNKPPDIVSWKAPLYQKTFKILMVMWVVTILLGITYEVYRRRRLQKIRKRAYFIKREQNLLWQKELKEAVHEILVDFEDLVKRLHRKLDQLDYKHAKQLLKLRTKMSKTYGIKFQYVRPSELEVPLQTILDDKDDYRKTHPKRTFSWRLRRICAAFVGLLRK